MDDSILHILPENYTEPVLLSPTKQPKPLFNNENKIGALTRGDNPVEPIKPPGSNARVFADPKSANKYFKYVFHPEDQYPGQNWLDQHEMVVASYSRNAVVAFAKTVQGKCRRKDLLVTGFEDILSIMRDAIQRSRSNWIPQNPAGTEVKEEIPDEIAVSPAALQELKKLTEFLRANSIATADAPQLMQNLRLQDNIEAYAAVRFLTLPYNLKSIYFHDDLSAAVEEALDAIRTIAGVPQSVSDGKMFSDLIAGSLHTQFAILTARYLQRNSYEAAAYGQTAVRAKQLTNDLNQQLIKFSRYSISTDSQTPVPMFRTTPAERMEIPL